MKILMMLTISVTKCHRMNIRIFILNIDFNHDYRFKKRNITEY